LHRLSLRIGWVKSNSLNLRRQGTQDVREFFRRCNRQRHVRLWRTADGAIGQVVVGEHQKHLHRHPFVFGLHAKEPVVASEKIDGIIPPSSELRQKIFEYESGSVDVLSDKIAMRIRAQVKEDNVARIPHGTKQSPKHSYAINDADLRLFTGVDQIRNDSHLAREHRKTDAGVV